MSLIAGRGCRWPPRRDSVSPPCAPLSGGGRDTHDGHENSPILVFFSNLLGMTLREYRARLIADVVTGKLDVREAAAGPAEVDPLTAKGDLVAGVGQEAGLQGTGARHAVEESAPLAGCLGCGAVWGGGSGIDD